MREVLDGTARARFAELLEEDPLPLDRAALAIALEEYPALEPERYLARLDDLAARVERKAPRPVRAASTLRALREVLHDEEGLRGNDDDYYDPRNSFLNEVLDRRLGIPITLSVVYLEVARRAGLRLEGVGFPGHFLAKYASSSGVEVFLDAFHGGEMLSADECVARYKARSGGKDLDARYLRGVSSRQIVARMLHNLKRVYVERKDDVRSFWVLDRILLLAPGQLEALRDRGLAAARLGGARAAARDLEAYLERAPAAADADGIRALLDGLRSGRGGLAN
jgi:regulator of sirC expression with transglutaminase-like and TPR domain